MSRFDNKDFLNSNAKAKSSLKVNPTIAGGTSTTTAAAAAASTASMVESLQPTGASLNAKQKVTDLPFSVSHWNVSDVLKWAEKQERCSKNVLHCLRNEKIDGEVLLALNEEDVRDFRYRLHYELSFAELKKLWLAVHALQQIQFHYTDTAIQLPNGMHANCCNDNNNREKECCSNRRISLVPEAIPLSGGLYGYSIVADSALACSGTKDCINITVPVSLDGRATHIPPEFCKTAISLGYSFVVTWITSFVMVIVHERVPDMKRYPPLPDIFLDNVPHIPWAFHMCEITGTLLFLIWSSVCIFHKYRTVLLRRFFALAGTVFLLRCCTMLITSLSVPGTHLQCNRHDFAVDDNELSTMQALELRISRAYTIWTGLGMSIQGVRTCGDYMFSGHTVTLTLLNFFITEYTPRNLYFLHTLSWLLNMFGIFFILAGHEHYSIDVFVAFYITSRLFLYYHTLANNQALMSGDSNRTRVWFPMFSYFESSVNGIIPNEYVTPADLLSDFFSGIVYLKDSIMVTARNFWIETPQLAMTSKNVLFVPSVSDTKKRSVSTSTNGSVYGTPTSQLSVASLVRADAAFETEQATDGVSTNAAVAASSRHAGNLNLLTSAAGLLHLEPQLTVDNLESDLVELVPRGSRNRNSKKQQ